MYQSFYNFSGKPFRLSPDPAFFFPSRGHKRALAYLRYGLNQDEGFVVITGSPGTGKTTLAKILLQEMESNVVVAHLTTTQLEADDMLRMVSASFGLRYEGLDKAGLLKSLETFLTARSRERKRALLVIDESQNLPARSLEELRMLSNLQVGEKSLLQIFLLGQEQFRKMLDAPELEQLRQRVIANYHLTPLAQDECQRYIESRLLHVGWNRDPHFAEVAYEHIHIYTKGIPRRINMLCDRILLFGCMEETHEITGEVVQLVKKEMDDEISVMSQQSLPAVEIPEVAEHSETSVKPVPSGESAIKPKDDAKDNAKDNAVQELPEIAKPAKEISRRETVNEPPEIPQVSQDSQPASAQAEPMSSLDQKISVEDVDEYEELDIDYAMFEEKPADSSVPKVQHIELGTDDDAPAQPPGKSPSQKFEEKESAKERKQSAKTKDKQDKSKPKEKQRDHDKHVMGNTVQKKKPELAESDDGSAQHSQISERELFRVIPGGKSSDSIFGPEESPDIAASAQPSSEDVKLRRILRLVLAFHRSPSRFPGLDNPAQPLPEGITELLELAISDDQVLNQVSPAAVMGISPVMLRAAVRFFVRRALFVADGDNYRILGLQPGANQAHVEKHYDLLMRLLRQDKQRGSADSVEQVGQAYEALSRLDQASQQSFGNIKINLPEPTDQATETKAAEALEPDIEELVIDFEEVEKRPAKQTLSSGFMAKPNEMVPVKPGGISRKTMRYASQFAVLGFGALVIILGLYIVQLEPGSPPPNDTGFAAGKEKPESVDSEAAKQRKRGLQFSDGTAGYLSEPQAEEGGSIAEIIADNSSVKDTPKENSADIDALRDELLAKQVVVSKTENQEADVISEPEESSNVEDAVEALVVPDAIADPETAAAVAASATAAAAVVAQDNRLAEAPAPTADPSQIQMDAPSQPSASVQANNQFDGRDIEIGQESVLNTGDAQTSMGSDAAEAGVVSSAPVVASQPATSSEAKTETQVATVSSPVEPAAPGSNLVINESELVGLVDQFVVSYEAGNIDGVMSLFTDTARTNNRTSAKGIKSDYTELFKSTTTRKMSINAINWNVENDHARGVGNYKAQINPTGSEGSQIFSGKITLQAQKSSPEDVRITRFYFSSQNVSTGPRMAEPNGQTQVAKAAAATATVKAKPKGVTQAEVDKLLSQFVRSYDRGNIEDFMALFAADAKTNDQSNASGIRKDHVDLFQSTAMRAMEFSDLKWTLNNALAKGEGRFLVKVQANGSTDVGVYKGRIIFTVEKNDNGLFITQMLHELH